MKVAAMIQAARDAGQDVTADMYPYVAGATALASSMPPWAADGGLNKLLQRLQDPTIRTRIKGELGTDHSDWENLYLDAGGASGVMVASVVNKDLKQFTGKTIAQIAAEQKKDPLEALYPSMPRSARDGTGPAEGRALTRSINCRRYPALRRS